MKVRQTAYGNAIFYVRSSVLGAVAMEVNSTAGVYRAYVYAGAGKIVAQQSYDGQFYWMHQDHLGSGHKMTDSTGVVKYRGEFDPYGQMVLSWSATGYDNINSKRFTGYERDTASGLDYANARMYNSGRGRFMQPDPAGIKAARKGEPESLNRYTYVSNDPVNFADSSGTCMYSWNEINETYGYWGETLCIEDPHSWIQQPNQQQNEGGTQENSCHTFARMVGDIVQRHINDKTEYDPESGLLIRSAQTNIMDALAKTFTGLSSASLSSWAIGTAIGDAASNSAFGSDGFAGPYFEADYPDGVRANQVQHAVGGLIAGFLFRAEGGLIIMNYREDVNDPVHGVSDINLNGQTVPMGAKLGLGGDEWKQAATGLGDWIRNTLCAPQ